MAHWVADEMQTYDVLFLGRRWNDPDPEILQKGLLSAEDPHAAEAKALALPRVAGTMACRIVAFANGHTVSFIQIDRPRRAPLPQ
ncbi:MAG: hypothetical protein ISQ86_08290 [Alphaproteobacteria bacterium]|nr:hypothetical protein [Alphaproteobacteria bacterium]